MSVDWSGFAKDVKLPHSHGPSYNTMYTGMTAGRATPWPYSTVCKRCGGDVVMIEVDSHSRHYVRRCASCKDVVERFCL